MLSTKYTDKYPALCLLWRKTVLNNYFEFKTTIINFFTLKTILRAARFTIVFTSSFKSFKNDILYEYYLF